MGEIARLLNPIVLNVVILALLALAVVVGINLVRTLSDARKTGREFKFWKFSLGGSGVLENTKVPERTVRGYRKILYVKVTYLSDKASGGPPFYSRVVSRLQHDQSVAVYDESVYYTLELFPAKKEVGSRTDRSTGVVDPRVVIPWRDRFVPRETTAREIRQSVQMDVQEETDTLLTVSHFSNGLQGEDNQDFASDVPEDAEYVRLIVDFSSIPGASQFISPKSAFIVGVEGNPALAAITSCGESVFMLSRQGAHKGEMLRMCFAVDWSRSPDAKPQAKA
jgi:hypothetical protein